MQRAETACAHRCSEFGEWGPEERLFHQDECSSGEVGGCHGMAASTVGELRVPGQRTLYGLYARERDEFAGLQSVFVSGDMRVCVSNVCLMMMFDEAGDTYAVSGHWKMIAA